MKEHQRQTRVQLAIKQTTLKERYTNWKHFETATTILLLTAMSALVIAFELIFGAR